ncbi:MAG: radical SAM protein [Candidatus Hydrogenedentes bacterium]|nr:radical SAM protein [Candidatus Hydrogenedentota bacterium]
MAYEKECENLINWYVYGKLPLSEIVFFITNRCNQRCVTCWQWEEDFIVSGKELPDEKWKELLIEAIEMGAHHLYIVGGGEPMVRGELVLELGEMAKKHGLFCVLHTNGTLLKKEHMDRLIQLCWDQIVVSLDGPNPGVNDFIRGHGTFDKVYRNLIYIRDHRIYNGQPIPDLGINFTITSTNYKYIPEMVELAKATGCGGIHATLVLPLSEQSKRFVLKEEEFKECLTFLKEGLALSRIYGIYSTFDSVMEEIDKKLKGEGEGFSASMESKKNSLINSFCVEPFLSLAISSDGRVGPCCMFWTDSNPSISENSLKEIWEGEFIKRLREILIRNAYSTLPPPCQSCPSQLRKRTEGIKRALLEREKSASKNILTLASRFLNRFKNEGVRGAVKRTWEYLYTLVRGI